MSMTKLNAFLTGGAKGLGKAFSETLLAEGAAKLYIADIDKVTGAKTVAELQSRYGKDKCKLLHADVADAKQFENSFKAAVSEIGHIDLMINNAGKFHETDWEPVIKLNLMALVRGCELAMNHMNKKNGGRGGRIINTCSSTAFMNYHVLPVYTATKHAMRAYTSSMALHPDQHETGVQFATLCPGPADTDLLKTLNPVTGRYVDTIWDFLESHTISVARANEGFTKLVRMPQVNGAVLNVDKTMIEFCKMEYVSLGPDYVPPK